MAGEIGDHTVFSPEHQHIIGVVRRLMQCVGREREARDVRDMVVRYFKTLGGDDGEGLMPRHEVRIAEVTQDVKHAEFMLDGAILEAWELLCPRDPAADRRQPVKE
jgi:hypothetical protein